MPSFKLLCMKSKQHILQNPPAPSFDLFRLSKSKAAVDLSPNTIRNYARMGLRLFRIGKSVFISKAELDSFIRGRGTLSTQ